MKYSIRTIFLCAILSFTLNSERILTAQSIDGRSPIYTGLVVATDAELLSGPGLRYYATETPARGTRLEVWQIRNDGWCAVRPMADSFSLVAPNALELNVPGPGLATVKIDGTPSYIGSNCGNAKHTTQVRLQRNEVVRLVDSQTSTDGLWCRIRPPAGEYRWIRANQIYALPATAEQTTLNEQMATIERIAVNNKPAANSQSVMNGQVTVNGQTVANLTTVHEASRMEDRGDSAVRTTAAAIPMADPGNQPATLPPPGATRANSRTVDSTMGNAMESGIPAATGMTGTVISDPTTQTYGYPMGAQAGMTPFQNGLIRISDRMSSMTQGDPAQWDLASLQGEVASLSGMAGSAEERQQAGMFEQQLVEYQRVQQEIAAGGNAANMNGSAGSSGFMGGATNETMTGTTSGMAMYGNGAYAGNGTVYSAGMGNMGNWGGNVDSYGVAGNASVTEMVDTSFQGRMKRFFERLQFWKIETPRQNYTGNWAIPMNRPIDMMGQNAGGYNGYNGGYAGNATRVGNAGGYGGTGDTTSSLPVAEVASGQVSGWRPRGQAVTNTIGNPGNNVVFGDQSKHFYQRTIPTTAETTPPPVPEGIVGN